MTQPQLPRFFKDGTGYCYLATPVLAKHTGLTPWDGDVDSAGYAADAPAPEEVAPPAGKRRAVKRAAEPAQQEPAQEPAQE